VHLDPAESERVARIERLLALAAEMLRDVERARNWLKSPKSALAGLPSAVLWIIALEAEGADAEMQIMRAREEGDQLQSALTSAGCSNHLSMRLDIIYIMRNHGSA
jgi:hypothetical protein